MKKENNVEEEIIEVEDNNMDMATKEKEIKDSYNTDLVLTEVELQEDNEEETKDEEETTKKDKMKKEKKPVNVVRLVINIVFGLIILIMISIVFDVICLTKFNIGPFFTIPVKIHNDGGTTEYYGIGYKVIKYKQTQGRRDMEIGDWNLKYKVEPITFQDIDLAIELKGNEEYTYQKYNKQFVRVISTLKEVDTKKHQITIGYEDEDGKYSLNIICDIVKEQKNINKLEKGKEITVIGTLDGFKNKKVNELHISNCFAEQ